MSANSIGLKKVSYVLRCILLIFLVNKDSTLSYFIDHPCFLCELHVYILCHLKHVSFLFVGSFFVVGRDNSLL